MLKRCLAEHPARARCVGIVGPSGSGKSTLTKLVQRFYMPQEGQVLVDGIDLAQVDPAWLRRHIGVVLQENLLFNRTSTTTSPSPTRPCRARRSSQVARLAGADEFIAKLPGGYDTMIEERGANLSGGQRQRIAIARALAHQPADPDLRRGDQRARLRERAHHPAQHAPHRRSGRTVIIIAHRLAAVRKADRIIGMMDGRIVEIGTHDELLKKPDGLYAHLWNLQTNGAVE